MSQKTTMKNSTNAYVLDNRHRIVSVSGAWDEFADENGGVTVSVADVCGRELWDFVAGDTTRMWLETVFQFSRLHGMSIERPYRCDSPDLKRFMRMRIDHEIGGILRIEHLITGIEQRSVPVSIRYGGNARQRCSICGRVHCGGWQETLAEHAEGSKGIIVIYTVCEDCQRLLPGI